MPRRPQPRILDRARRRVILIYLLSAVIGVIAGLGAVVFRWMISLNKAVFFDLLGSGLTNLTGSRYVLLVLPALGGLIVGPLTEMVAPETRGHGVPEVMEAVMLKGGRIRKRVALAKIVASSITIGSGGSAGREGPIAQIGAASASAIGQVFKLSRDNLRLLVTCGLAAGIAGTFNAPLGGALFGLEVLMRGVSAFNAIPVIFSSVIGATTASIFLGRHPAFRVVGLSYWDPREIPLYILLGLAFGLLAVAWVRLFYGFEEFFRKLSVPGYLKPALGGLGAGVLMVLFAGYGVGGVGYEGIDKALSGSIPLRLLLLLGVAKMLSTSLTIGSGGSGGVFAPSLYIGGMFGLSLGLVYQGLFPGLVRQPATYALAGMASLFAGAAQAPMTVIVMVPEMSEDYSLIAPFMASASMSYLVAWLLLRGSSIYTLKLERRGVRVRQPGVPQLIR
ncbi:MAG: chloride channel protein [Desulfurococcales archaeon]|nr:chloride channel protein [Desulfurococcales archaeon]